MTPTRIRHAAVLLSLTLLLSFSGPSVVNASEKPAAGPLKVCPENPRYFANPSGKAVLLAGAHTWPTIIDMGPADPPPVFDFDKFLDGLCERGHSFTRLWTWEHATWNTKGNKEAMLHHCRPLPYLRTGPGLAKDGKPRFDLTKYEPEYFTRLRSRVEACGRRGIYASVMLFEGWAMQHSPGAWQSHPFHPENNINGINGDADGDGNGLEVHELKVPAVTAIQEAYVRHVIEAVGDLDNVLYEISNENHPASTAWQYHTINFIHATEKARPKQHPVGMTFQYKGGSNQALFASPAEWISPNAGGTGAAGKAKPGETNYKTNPPAGDGKKVVLSDTDHLGGLWGDVPWVWKTFTRGHNPLFMDPYDGKVLGTDDKWEPVRQAVGHVARLSRRVNLTEMTPQPDLASSKYCLAGGTGKAVWYIVFVPGGGKVTVDLAAAAGQLPVEWIDPKTGKSTPAEKAEGGAKREFTPPAEGDAVLVIGAAAK